MFGKFLLGFTTIAVIAASAASYNVSFADNTSIDGKSIKAGDYKVELKDNMAVLRHKKEQTEVPAHLETAGSKFANTMVRFGRSGEVQEICIGGTNTKLVFGANGSSSGGVQ